ncbi:MAG: TIGR03943 family protein [Oscillospiraceae bacterium]|nr:TIGR03943 family protein [Oscillospiraceae bacterium]
MEVPVYLMTGFLESGKTSFILETLNDKEFSKGERTLVIACEQGEVEYDEKILKASKSVVEFIEDEENFNPENLTALIQKHRPSRVMLEYNGMWSLRDMAEKAPKNWIFYQIFMFVDHTKFDVYLNNMRQLLSDNIAVTDIVIFNRCEQGKVDKKRIRRILKSLNPRVDMMFEYMDGEVEQGFQGDDEMPFDVNADPIDIVHDDFGLWYVDIMSNAKRYKDRNIRVRGMVFRASTVPKGYFVVSRRAMTCCADDIQVVGILVKSPDEGKFKDGDWVEVTGKIVGEKQEVYRGVGPVIIAKSVSPTEKADSELVYFN